MTKRARLFNITMGNYGEISVLMWLIFSFN